MASNWLDTGEHLIKLDQSHLRMHTHFRKFNMHYIKISQRKIEKLFYLFVFSYLEALTERKIGLISIGKKVGISAFLTGMSRHDSEIN